MGEEEGDEEGWGEGEDGGTEGMARVGWVGVGEEKMVATYGTT